MGAALAVVDRWEDLRSMAHDALDTWLDQVEAGTAKAPTLREISERFMASRLALLSACLEAVIRQQYAAELQQTEAVCGCARRLRRRRLDAKEFSTVETFRAWECRPTDSARGYRPPSTDARGETATE